MKKLTLLFAALILVAATAFAQTRLGSSNTYYKLEGYGFERKLTISGTGDMPNYTRQDEQPWHWNGTGDPFIVANVVIQDGVTSIGSCAFSGCSLTSLTLPPSVTTIGSYAFEHSGLTSITIPNNSLTAIGDYAFAGCWHLTSITIPKSATAIGNGAFYRCSFTSITIPESVTAIGKEAFGGCYDLTSITIPASVTTIGEYAFSGCEKLASLIWLNPVPLSSSSIAFGWAFSHIDSPTCTLKVPSGSLAAYQAESWDWFFYIEEFTEVPEVSVTPADNSATIKWEPVAKAVGYKLVLYKDSQYTVLLSGYLMFDANGKYLGFVEDGTRSAEAGFSYKIENLSSGTPYYYLIQALDADNNVLAITCNEFRTTGASTGTNNTQAALVTVSPNPTTGIVNISQEAEIKVYTLQGALLLQTVGNQVDLSAYPQGVYFLQIDGQPVKVIKQ